MMISEQDRRWKVELFVMLQGVNEYPAEKAEQDGGNHGDDERPAQAVVGHSCTSGSRTARRQRIHWPLHSIARSIAGPEPAGGCEIGLIQRRDMRLQSPMLG